jgi:hypothetical protein
MDKYVKAIIKKVDENPGHYEFDSMSMESMIYKISLEFGEGFIPNDDDVLDVFVALMKSGKVNAEKDRLWPIGYTVK